MSSKTEASVAEVKVVRIKMESFVNITEQTRLGVGWFSLPHAVIKIFQELWKREPCTKDYQISPHGHHGPIRP